MKNLWSRSLYVIFYFLLVLFCLRNVVIFGHSVVLFCWTMHILYCFLIISSKLKYYYNNSGFFFLLNIDINIDGKILQFLKVQSRFTFNQQNQVIDIIIFRLTLKCVMIYTLIFKSDTVPSCHSVYYIVMILLNIYSQVYYLPVLRSPNSLYKCLSVCGVSLWIKWQNIY